MRGKMKKSRTPRKSGVRLFTKRLARYSLVKLGVPAITWSPFSSPNVAWLWLSLLTMVSVVGLYSSGLEIARLSLTPLSPLSFERVIVLASERGDYETAEQLLNEGVQKSYLDVKRVNKLHSLVYPKIEREARLKEIEANLTNPSPPLILLFSKMRLELELQEHERAAETWQQILHQQPNTESVRQALSEFAAEFPSFARERLLQSLQGLH